MKYKIKVVVSLDGVSRFFPMVKKHWYSRWECIYSQPFTGFYTLKEAEDSIGMDIIDYKSNTTSHSYCIEYKEKEE